MKHFNNILLSILIFLFGSLATLVLLIRSSNASTHAMVSPTPIESSTSPAPTQNTNSKPEIKHVFVIVEENHDWKTIYANPDAPYINKTLLTKGAYATDYHNVPKSLDELHPSEPNYILLESGMTSFPDHAFKTDDSPSAINSTATKNHLVSLLEKNGYSWKSYQEDISGENCPIKPTKNYAPKHNPVVFFQDVSGNPPKSQNDYCQEHVRPLNELATDLTNDNVPNYVFITPNLEHDMHNGTIAQADTWLSQIVPEIMNSDAFKKNGALFITWDEGSEENEESEENNPIGMIIESPFIKKGYTNSKPYSHASYLKTVEEIFHLTPLLGLANDPKTDNLFDFFNFK